MVVEKNFGTLNGLTQILTPMPVVVIPISLQSIFYLYRRVFVFFKFGLVKQAGTIQSIGIRKPVSSPRTIPMAPLIKQMLVTFPPIYKTRTGRVRPLKGQLWPRTR